MTDIFGDTVFDRDELDEPLDVSPSLLGIADRPLAYLFDGWESRIDLGNPDSYMDCVFENGAYVIPHIDDVVRRAIEVLDSEQLSVFFDSWVHSAIRRYWEDRESKRSYVARRVSFSMMGVDEVLAHALYGDLCLFKEQPGDDVIHLKTPAVALYSQSERLTPLLFGDITRTFCERFPDESAVIPISEVLHVVRRMPNAFVNVTPNWGGHIFNDVPGSGVALRESGDEAWMSYVMLTLLHARRLNSLGEGDILNHVRDVIALGLDFDTIKPYIRLGLDAAVIQQAVSNGIHPDMLDRL